MPASASGVCPLRIQPGKQPDADAQVRGTSHTAGPLFQPRIHPPGTNPARGRRAGPPALPPSRPPSLPHFRTPLPIDTFPRPAA